MISDSPMDINLWVQTHWFVPVLFLAVAVLASWYATDMRSIQKWLQRKSQLSIEGRWKELETHLQQASKSIRPFAWFYRRCLQPGSLEAQYALFLLQHGRFEEALAKVDEALRRAETKPRVFAHILRAESFGTLRASLKTKTLILTGMGRYYEGREAASKLRHLDGGKPNAPLALLEYYCGHLDDALAQARAVPPGDEQYDSMRGVMALAYTMKGEFDQALQALLYEPGDVSKYYGPEKMAMVSQDPEGAKVIELQRRKLASVLPSLRLILLAHVYLAKEQHENADRALDLAEKSLGTEPGGLVSYCRNRSYSLAAQGKIPETENYIARLRSLAQQFPKRSFVWETHFAAGRAYFHLERFSEALAEFNEAQRAALHPVEKHSTAYWTARTHEAAGNHREAVQYYEIVAADSIPSWMRKQAGEALTRFKGV